MSKRTRKSRSGRTADNGLLALLANPERLGAAGSMALLIMIVIFGAHDVFARLQGQAGDDIRMLFENRKPEPQPAESQPSPPSGGLMQSEPVVDNPIAETPKEPETMGVTSVPAASNDKASEDVSAHETRIKELLREIERLRNEISNLRGRRRCGQCEVGVVAPLRDGAVIDIRTPNGAVRRAIATESKEVFSFCLNDPRGG